MREKILQALIHSGDHYLSGESLSQTLGISRAAIWKHISALRSSGYSIESVTHKGYRLIKHADILSYLEISPYLRTKKIGRAYVHHLSIASTNNEAKNLAESGAQHGTVVISEEQTLGKGRLGTQWLSTKGSGIWMSIILRPRHLHPKHAESITQTLSMALVNALSLFDIKATLYYPNDILINETKISGILTEMSTELTQINYLILGIGVHVTGNASIEQLTHKKINRKRLTAEILNAFECLYAEN